MARIDTLGNFLTDVAKSIKDKKGDQTPIKASDFDTEIANLPSGGGDISEYFSETLSAGSSNYPIVMKSILKFPRFTFNSYSCYSMFYGFGGVEIDCSGFDTSSCTSFSTMFYECNNLIRLDLHNFIITNTANCSHMFRYCYKLAYLDISGIDFRKVTQYTAMFNYCGTNCLASDGAYRNGIPYIYVKDEYAQNFILTEQGLSHDATWSTNNVIIAGSEQDLRGQA